MAIGGDRPIFASILAHRIPQDVELLSRQGHGLEIVPVDLRARDHIEELAEARQVDFLGRRGVVFGLAVGADQQDAADLAEVKALAVVLDVPRQDHAHVDHAAQGEIVGDAAIQQMYIFGAVGIEIKAITLGKLMGARQGIGLAFVGAYPGGNAPRALGAEALERDGIEQDRKAVRGRHGTRHRIGQQIRTDQVELVLDELEFQAGVDVGRIDGNQRSSGVLQVGKGRAVKHELVIDLRHAIVGSIVGIEQRLCESPWQQIASINVGLYVPVQEIILEIREDLVVIETVIGRGKAAAGDRRHDVDFVEQVPLVAVNYDGIIPEAAQNAIAESGRALAAAGKAEQDHG